MFGVRIKTIVILLIFSALLLVAVNRSEIESLLQMTGIDKSIHSPSSPASTDQQSRKNDIVVDQKMLEEAIQEVQLEQLNRIESEEAATPTDRFFYIVELHGGSDLEGVELIVEPDYVTIVSNGGTQTTIEREMVREIKRFKLPPSPDN
jgi:hypothetical protein